MTLAEKYKSVTDAASSAGVNDLQVREQNGVLYVDGTAPNGSATDQIWNSYAQVDPSFSAGDMVLNIKTAVDPNITRARVATESSNLNVRRSPSTDGEIVGKAAKDEVVDIISRSNEQWWLVRTKDGEEGYAYAQYLTPEA